jgi:hypothetical protein
LAADEDNLELFNLRNSRRARGILHRLNKPGLLISLSMPNALKKIDFCFCSVYVGRGSLTFKATCSM